MRCSVQAYRFFRLALLESYETKIPHSVRIELVNGKSLVQNPASCVVATLEVEDHSMDAVVQSVAGGELYGPTNLVFGFLESTHRSQERDCIGVVYQWILGIELNRPQEACLGRAPVGLEREVGALGLVCDGELGVELDRALHRADRLWQVHLDGVIAHHKLLPIGPAKTDVSLRVARIERNRFLEEALGL